MSLPIPELPAHFLKRSQRITVYPNLVSIKQCWLQLYNIDSCVFSVQLHTLSGFEMFRRFFYHTGLYSNHTIKIPAKLERGIYKMLICCDDIRYNQLLIIV